jgi:hypothetical protein
MLKFRWPKRPTPNRLPESRPPAPAALGGYALLFGEQGTPAAALQGAREPIVFIGNCIGETVVQGLAATPAVTKHFTPFAVPLHLKQLGDPDVVQAVSDARFVFIQGLALRHMDHIQTLVKSHCQIVNVPDFVLYSVWPFDGHNGYRDPAVTATLPQAAAHQHDGALARLREIEPDKGKRLRRYRDLDFDLASRIDRVIETQNRFLVDMDKGNDAQMGRFIARHFRDRPLFYNCTHPSEILFQELCEFCWTKLDLRGPPPRIPGLDAWRGWRVPVHPRIAERVGLTWANERTRYAYGTLGSVTWDEWARHYIETYG